MSKILGITIKHLHLSEFSNGATQHIYTIAKLFKEFGWSVVLINSEKDVPKENNNHMNLPIVSRFLLKNWLDDRNIKPVINFDLIMFFEWYEKGGWIK